jgi:hypothetical protein
VKSSAQRSKPDFNSFWIFAVSFVDGFAKRIGEDWIELQKKEKENKINI